MQTLEHIRDCNFVHIHPCMLTVQMQLEKLHFCSEYFIDFFFYVEPLIKSLVATHSCNYATQTPV